MKMSGSRKSYTIQFKKQMVEESRNVRNLTAFCKEKNIGLRMLNKWKKKYEYLAMHSACGRAKARKCGSGPTAFYPELEDLIYDYIADKRALGFVVRRSEIQKVAQNLAPEFDISLDKFKASTHWVTKFLNRHHLSLRRSTTLFKLEEQEIVRRAISFKKFVDDIDFSKYSL